MSKYKIDLKNGEQEVHIEVSSFWGDVEPNSKWLNEFIEWFFSEDEE